MPVALPPIRPSPPHLIAPRLLSSTTWQMISQAGIELSDATVQLIADADQIVMQQGASGNLSSAIGNTTNAIGGTSDKTGSMGGGGNGSEGSTRAPAPPMPQTPHPGMHGMMPPSYGHMPSHCYPHAMFSPHMHPALMLPGGGIVGFMPYASMAYAARDVL